MKKIVYFLLVVVFPANLRAFDLAGTSANDIKARTESLSLPAPSPKAVVPVEKMLREYEDVFMNTRRDPAGREIEAHHIYGGFKITISRISKDEFSVTADLGTARERWAIRRRGGDYLLSGAGVAGQAIALGRGKYVISSDVSGRDSGLKYMEVRVNRRSGSGSYTINGLGMNLKADSYGVTGNYNTRNFSRKAAALAISVALVLQGENPDKQF